MKRVTTKSKTKTELLAMTDTLRSMYGAEMNVPLIRVNQAEGVRLYTGSLPTAFLQAMICRLPRNSAFIPACPGGKAARIVLALDEYEAVRLIDLEGCTQQECAAQMRVSRTTVQGIYDSARRKIADALVNGKELAISGGDCVVCPHYCARCGRGCGRRCAMKTDTEDEAT